MRAKSLAELRQELVYAEARVHDYDWIVRMQGRIEATKIRKQIAARLRKQKRSKSDADSTTP